MKPRRIPNTLAHRITLLGAALLVVASSMGLGACSSPSPAAESAARIPFDPAFASAYEPAAEAVQLRTDDAKLLAVRSSSFSQAHFAPTWTFLFYSWQRTSAYTVEVSGGEAKVTDNPGLTFAQSSFAEVPDTIEVAMDADEAYALVVDSLKGDGSYMTCRAYLMTYISEDEGSPDDAYAWFFSFNETEDLKQIHLDPAENLAPAATYAVNANTGEVRQVA